MHVLYENIAGNISLSLLNFLHDNHSKISVLDSGPWACSDRCLKSSNSTHVITPVPVFWKLCCSEHIHVQVKHELFQVRPIIMLLITISILSVFSERNKTDFQVLCSQYKTLNRNLYAEPLFLLARTPKLEPRRAIFMLFSFSRTHPYSIIDTFQSIRFRGFFPPPDQMKKWFVCLPW